MALRFFAAFFGAAFFAVFAFFGAARFLAAFLATFFAAFFFFTAMPWLLLSTAMIAAYVFTLSCASTIGTQKIQRVDFATSHCFDSEASLRVELRESFVVVRR
ncbi:MAG: hypothetical protein K2X34_03480 [Hyphomonadaceae bacterium]|nr:hypothetical protein [Hyphomonadaceae bacterium]